MIVVGAGLAGLIAGHVFPTATILERDTEPKEGAHRALLRFRSDAISLITGIPFRRVTVRKGIWTDGRFVAPSIKLANFYSRKVTGRFVDRSIWDVETVERWIAPEDFYGRLVSALRGRIEWEFDATIQGLGEGPVISTIPLHVAAARWLKDLPQGLAFAYAPISVQRWKVFDADLHQTIYYPSPATSTYRASITGDLLIVESMDEEGALTLEDVLRSFGLADAETMERGAARQTYGKIAPIDDRIRRELIHRLTIESDIYSVGRFATWRNLILDDIVKDLRIVKSLIESDDAYTTHLKQAEGTTT